MRRYRTYMNGLVVRETGTIILNKCARQKDEDWGMDLTVFYKEMFSPECATPDRNGQNIA